MEAFRDSLITGIDAVVSQLYEQQNSNGGHPQLQIEAVVLPQDRLLERRERTQTYVLGRIDVDAWRSPRPSEVSSDSSPHTQTETNAFAVPTQPSQDRRSAQETLDGTTAQLQHSKLSNGQAPDGERELRPRRKEVGGLRLGHPGSAGITPPRTPSPPNTRQLGADGRNFPKRRKLDADRPAKLQASTVDKLIEGIWEQIHKPNCLVFGHDLAEALDTITSHRGIGDNASAFADLSRRCRQVTCASRTARSLEVIVQAYWVDCYDASIEALKRKRPDLRTHEHKKMVMMEACASFEWSEKELRNRM